MGRSWLASSLILGVALGCEEGNSQGDLDDAGASTKTDGSVGDSDGDASTDAEAVCAGDRWLSDDESLTPLAGCEIITGNLSITGNGLRTVTLPRLVTVQGFLTVWGNPLLTSVQLEKLTTVGGYLDVSANEMLTTLALPALASVNERNLTSPFDLIIRDNALTSCQAQAIHDQVVARGFTGQASVSDAPGKCAP